MHLNCLSFKLLNYTSQITEKATELMKKITDWVTLKIGS